MQGKHHEFLLLFSFFSPSQLNYTQSLHSSLRSLIPHQIIPICKYTSAFSFPFISNFDWGLFEGLNCVLNILFPKNHCQLPYRSVLSLSSCSQLKHTYCPHAKAVLLCHIASLFCLYPEENTCFRNADLLLWALCLTSVRMLSTDPDSLTPAAFLPCLTELASCPLF